LSWFSRLNEVWKEQRKKEEGAIFVKQY